MKVAVVSYIKGEDHTRARTIRKGFLACVSSDVVLITNRQSRQLSYLRFLVKLWRENNRENPDVYVLTYRGYGLLLPLIFIARKKPIIFDEFINPLEDIIYEHHDFRPNGSQAKLLGGIYRHLVKHCLYILADTDAHAQYSARLNRISLDHYKVVPISADERIFHPSKSDRVKASQKFSVIHIASSRPRDGLKFVLDASVRLKDETNIEFTIVDSDGLSQPLIVSAIERGAHVRIEGPTTDRQLARLIQRHDLCLAGPFGNTVQARLIISESAYKFLASSKPTVIGRARAGGVLINSKNCLVASQASAKSITDKILWSCTHKRRLLTIAGNGFSTYQKMMSKKVVASECQAMLDEIL